MPVFLRIVSVFLVIAAGAAVRRRGLLDGPGTARMSRLVVVLFYPSLIYATLVRSFTFPGLIRHWRLPAGAFLIMLCGFAAGTIGAKALGLPSGKLRRTLHFQCTINNYSFLPLPIVLLLWGETGMANLIFSTVGSEIAVWTLGILALSGGPINRASLRHLLTPPMLAIAAAAGTLAALDLAHVSLPPPGTTAGALWNTLISALDMLGKATVPLAMVVAGSRMSELHLPRLITKPQVGMVILRNLVIPGMALALLRLLPMPASAYRVLAVVAVMPCAVASVILCDVYGGDSEFAAGSVLATHIAGLITIPLWLALMA